MTRSAWPSSAVSKRNANRHHDGLIRIRIDHAPSGYRRNSGSKGPERLLREPAIRAAVTIRRGPKDRRGTFRHSLGGVLSQKRPIATILFPPRLVVEKRYAQANADHFLGLGVSRDRATVDSATSMRGSADAGGGSVCRPSSVASASLARPAESSAAASRKPYSMLSGKKSNNER